MIKHAQYTCLSGATIRLVLDSKKVASAIARNIGRPMPDVAVAVIIGGLVSWDLDEKPSRALLRGRVPVDVTMGVAQVMATACRNDARFNLRK